jgi:Protein of unknown function (DUF3431)
VAYFVTANENINLCSVKLVVSSCKDNLDWLYFMLRSYPQVWLSDYTAQLNVAVLEKCPFKKERSSFSNTNDNSAYLLKEITCSLEYMNIFEILPGFEASANLEFLVKEYDNFNSHQQLVFVHADIMRHILNPSSFVASLASAVHCQTSDYVGLADTYLHAIRYWGSSADRRFEIQKFTDYVFKGIPNLRKPASFAFHCCGHFIISTENVKRRPKEFYSRILAALNDPALLKKSLHSGFPLYSTDFKNRSHYIGELMEHVWIGIFHGAFIEVAK